MGRYSDSEGEPSRRLKRKKKRRSRSHSRSEESNDSHYSHSHKHKKSKKKHRRSKSDSRSPDRQRPDRSLPPRRRSRTPDRSRRSRSYDRGRRSWSTERRRSRSYERSHRSRSHSQGRRSSSGSRDKIYCQKRSSSYDREHCSRSLSGSRSHSRRSSADRRRGRHSASPGNTVHMSGSNTMDEIPGFKEMTPGEQAQAKLKMALRAAALADEKLKDQSPAQATASPHHRQEFVDAIASIESDCFAPSTFKSSRSTKASSLKQEKRDATDLPTHAMAMFGAVGSSVVFSKTETVGRTETALEDNPGTLFDTSLHMDPEEKMKKWIQKLSALRKKKLEGELISTC